MSEAMQALRNLIGSEIGRPVPPAVADLSDRIRHGRNGIAAVLFYGAGLWKPPAADTVHDFYVLVDSYRVFDRRRLHAGFGALLPPNVYYLEHGMLRCKYAVIRRDQFCGGAAGRALSTQIWGRFAQPCRLTYARDEGMREVVIGALANAVVTFHAQTLPFLPENQRDPRSVWIRGLTLSYSNEWRSESRERVNDLYSASREALDARSRLVMPAARPAARVATRGARRIAAKAVYFLQLVKAVFTFDGGVDYALWKIERQSGVRLTATDFQRRHPLLSAWPLVWKAWRAGALR